MKKSRKKAFESILDFPQKDLCQDLWSRTSEGSYEIREDASQKIQKLVVFMTQRFKMKNIIVHLTGSLMSNSYSESSDVDVHFCSDLVKEELVEELNKRMRKIFSEEYSTSYPEDSSIGSHPLEVYFQVNPAQDLMSVGCYDFTNKKWLVGPEFTSEDFDPYEEYFDKDMKNMSDVIDDVRQMIFKTYEMSLAIAKSKSLIFKDKLGSKLMSVMKDSHDLFMSLKEHRKAKSTPTTPQQALKLRSSSSWKTADSSYKLMDKFGYIGQLLVISKCFDKISTSEMTLVEAADEIIRSFSENISSQNINDSENIDESAKDLVSIPMIAMMLSIPSVLPYSALASNLKDAQKSCQVQNVVFNVSSSQVKSAMNKTAVIKKAFKDLNFINTVNALSMVLWLEARGEGIDGIKAVLSVIMNRCGNNLDYIPDVLKQKGQFECISRYYSGGWTNKDYKYFVPYSDIAKDSSNRLIWEQIQELAKKCVEGKFKSTIGNRNSYLNKRTASKTAVDSWGTKMDLKINNHEFGYLPEYDGTRMIPGTMSLKPKNIQIKSHEVVVKAGDTLSKIAKVNNTTIQSILSKNPTVKDPNKLKIGQKILI